ncbi:MAG: two-component sensor histidine kinase [Polaromonas sp. 39-63-203]|jgi:signal transduction histidine kinase|uniref:sensor histidine kinase n=1 Tax=Polaromonas sp. TaxID=1869339 RepID=UPI000BC85D30|nr:sensor histidine kinase [Polaromonas sp.]OYY52010.1 MAG: two-component sensor histidine kinase [Polaromonas sp. 35-63-240]OYZ83474.1 MAG: two-component sensor histidine kinase [Polaromonas sp. 24-62-144]OZA97040.1 MAG: two-component sensor histidine kinase [Polaromonas sp. 39-63-203]HQS30638.1 sensor histidine kinase [Polaromonas sp.]HQS90000.1 sensor histidine kinase [Polaromonas sp.]
MKLSHFIEANIKEILEEWDQFALTLFPSGAHVSASVLRDHARGILMELTEDMETAQSAQQQADKSKGEESKTGEGESAASAHGIERHYSGFTLTELAAEFRALRATVLRLWLPKVSALTEQVARDMVRFNEAIDQALAESVATYSQQNSRARDTFLAILGHDLRSPLMGIRLSAKVLQKPDVTVSAVEQSGTRILTSAALMSSMVNDLLEYGRGQLGGVIRVKRQPVNLRDIGQAAIEEAKTAHPEFQFALETSGELHGNFDGARLQQVFSNLLNNAAQYGYPAHVVNLMMDGRPDHVTVQVCNVGPVIPPESLRAIFDPLVQLSIGEKPSGPFSNSAGLGLYIARELTFGHDGTIKAESSAEGGTVFTVQLPRKAAGQA